MKKLDTIDLRILDLLQMDARITNKELSAKLSLSTTPVFERVKKLERFGYIKDYVALIDRNKLDKKIVTYISVSLKEHRRDFAWEFAKQVITFNEVMECYVISGRSDYLIKVIVEDMTEFRDFMENKVAGIENVGKVETAFVTAEIKATTAIPLSGWMDAEMFEKSKGVDYDFFNLEINPL
ncbi:MAG: Lrp/AsnC family transcriptional regulator [Flavobacteriales bacterium]|nr:Lrp/AsnC family transcriptional regulator [Flavobacteriales bacterium]